MKVLKTLLAAVAFGAVSLTAAPVLAHGDSAPQHGGIVKSANDLSFELVAETGGAALYIDDHGAPFDTAGASGKLTVLAGSDKTAVDLKPAGGNKLLAAGASLPAGAKVVAVITTAQNKTASVRFNLP